MNAPLSVHSWAGFLVMLGSFFRSKIDQKMIKIQHRFWIVFGRFWDPSWRHLGGQNRPKMVQVGLNTALGTLSFENREFSRNIGRRNVWSVSRAPRQHPKRPKIAPRRPQDGLEDLLFRCRNLSSILIRFGCRFGAILAPILVPFGLLFGTLWGSKIDQNPSSFLFLIFVRFGTRFGAILGSQEAPQRHPRVPKRQPRMPKRHPRAPKRQPRAPKRHPRTSKRQ